MNRRRTVLLLPGQGAQRERMAAGLYGVDAAFTAHMAQLPAPLLDAWLTPAPNPLLDEAAVAQPLLLAVGHALGRAVHAAAGPPDVVLGHSVGELAAACLAGVFAPGAVATLAAARARVLAGDGAAGRGGMLAVAAAPEELAALGEGLAPGVALAAVNGPRQSVLAGPAGPLAQTGARLRAAGFTARELRSGHAFHSPVMAPVARRFGEALAELGPRAPGYATGLPTLVSTRTAAPVRPAEAADPHFWAGQLARPVLYWPALCALLDAEGDRPGLLLLDASADRSLGAPARRHPAVRSGASEVLALLAPARRGGGPADAEVFSAAMGRAVDARRQAAS